MRIVLYVSRHAQFSSLIAYNLIAIPRIIRFSFLKIFTNPFRDFRNIELLKHYYNAHFQNTHKPAYTHTYPIRNKFTPRIDYKIKEVK